MLTEEFLRDGSRKEIYMDTEHTQAKNKLKVRTNKFLKNLVMLNPQKNAKTIILETGVMVWRMATGYSLGQMGLYTKVISKMISFTDEENTPEQTENTIKVSFDDLIKTNKP